MRKLLVLAGIVAMVSAGCGDSNGSGSGSGSVSASGSVSGSGTGPEGPPVTVPGKTNDHGIKEVGGDGKAEVELDDYYFGPTFLKVKAGQSLTFALHNEGKASHTFTVAGGPDEEVAPGAKKSVTLTGPARGVVLFYCRFHQGEGMQGALYINAGDALVATPAGGGTSTSGGYGY